MYKIITVLSIMLFFSVPVIAVTSTGTSTSSGKPTPPAPPPPQPEFKKELVKIPPKPGPVKQEFYPNPGIVSFVHGKWEGSDYLLNVPDHIGINIEVLQPESSKVAFSTEPLHQKIVEHFKKASITPMAEARKDGPPLPFLHVLIMLFPIDKGYSAYVGVRLFEEIKKWHVEISGKTALQAITWERQTLIIFPTEALNDQITKTVDEIMNSFVERYEFFEKYKHKDLEPKN